MRTTKRELAKLFREARQLANVKTNREVLSLASKAMRWFDEVLAVHGFQVLYLTPYSDGVWKLTCVPDNDSNIAATTCTMILTAFQWIKEPTKTADRFIHHDWPQKQLNETFID